MLFNEQIKKRSQLEQVSMQEAVDNLASAIGASTNGGIKIQRGNAAIKDILKELNVKNYTLEDDLFESLENQFERILRAEGIMQRRVNLSGEWWKKSVGPLLGRDKEENLVALLPMGWKKGYRFKDSEGKRVKVDASVMKNFLSDSAVCFYLPLPQRKITYKDLLKFIIPELKGRDILMLFVLSFVVTLFGMFVPFVNKQIFDNIIPNQDYNGVFVVAVLLVCASIGSILFSTTKDFVLARIKDLVQLKVQPAVMSRSFSLHPDFFMKRSPGELSERITSVSTLCNLMSDVILSSSLGALFSLAYIFQLFEYARPMFEPAMIILLLQIFVICLTFYYNRVVVDIQLKEHSAISSLLFNLFSGIQKIKLTGSEMRSYTKWATMYKKSAEVSYNPPLILKLSQAITTFITLAGTAWLYYVAMAYNVSPSDYIAFQAAYALISGAILSLASNIVSFARITPLLEMAAPIMDAVPENGADAPQVTNLSGRIEIMNVSFRYDEEMPMVLENLNIKISPGEYIGIVGKSGCGKSTLLKILLGFITPQQGTIFYDDYDLGKVNKESLRQRIGTCLQSGGLFPGDIFSNITVAAPWCGIDDAWRAAKLANIDKDIEALPMGMHTLISEGGSGGFSGGQKQRLLIARALLNSPAILFFDEATSALDNISQKQVSENLDSLGCTRVVIAHRLSTIRNCDRILVLDKGSIAEEGTFDELMEKRGLFYEMSKRQM